MRLRNIPGSREAIAQNRWCIQESEHTKGQWHTIFGNQNPLHIEIGMGKGKFIMALARQNPQINYVGIEKYSSVLLRALQKMEAEPLENIRFIRMDAENICEMFDHEEVAQIYLNFSDPWPKDRHAKRRLTSHQFFERYQQILASNGTVEFKTDNTALFDFSLEEVKEAGWKLDAFTRNLHQDNTMMEGNVMTEYEERFSKMGNPIYKLIASLPQK
ncbi:MAG: tRNA (guanosine(46)-N7)-methyltransferase TrmB [Lachnospiraceae bacterium]|nr:tRNA (guanosine(46)-N7)-methyltransferase TrmB [Lachnospiraceae bacterium]